MPILEFCLRLLLATGAGVAIGFERQRKRKNAGIRTNTLVAAGSCIFALISMTVTEDKGDPSRIIGQIVTGIGFLGAGVILHHGVTVLGLTTAATIWCSSAIGSLAGVGLYAETVVCTLLVIIVNTLFKNLDSHYTNKDCHDDEASDQSS